MGIIWLREKQNVWTIYMQTFFFNRAALDKGDCVTTHPKHVSFIIQFAKIRIMQLI